ncbi:SPOR domain-containing protein [Sulfurimonas sp.]
MTDKNELSDIVLNKGTSSSSNKKIVLAVATLGVILIIVVMLMNSLNSNSADNLPQAVLPPEPQQQAVSQSATDEPLFEEVEVMQEDEPVNNELDKIAQKLKEESAQETADTQEIQKPVVVKTKTTTAKVVKKVTQKTKTVKKVALSGKYYIQVGSFSKYEPNKKFLKSIHDLGFNYKFHKIGNLNKVLVGPFKTQKEANSAKRVLRAKVEPGAFSVQL